MRWKTLLPAFGTTALLLAGCDVGKEPSAAAAAADAGPPWFAEVAAEAGMDFRHESGHQPGRFLMPEINAGGVGLLDFDNDGLLDVFLVNGGFADPARTNPPGHRLYRNLGGWRFEDVTARAGVGANAGYGMGVACGDYDGDGWTDLYVLNLRGNVLLRNRGDGAFEDVTARAGVAGEEWSSSAAFLDFDGDGHLD
ncbi:MAG TPA: VCBS repeat-containing protein, partial [Verrucomicrobiota bacterium]|nr:VCBS repeat-containing protein [Verrucomicrobiota bacterium]